MNLQDLYITLSSFPALVFDNVFAPSLLRATYHTWPSKDWDNWITVGHASVAHHFQSNAGRSLPPAALLLLEKMSSFPLEDFYGPLALSTLKFFPDLSFHTGGMQAIPQVEAIPTSYKLEHPTKRWKKLVNLVLFITPDWEEEYNGELVFHGSKKTSIAPLFNRLIVYTAINARHISMNPINPNVHKEVRKLHTSFWTYLDGD